MEKRILVRVGAVVSCVFLGMVAAQAQSPASLRVSVLLVDSDLNVKPVPRHVLTLRKDGVGEAIRLVMGFDGKAEIKLSPGTYVMESEHAVEFQGHSYRWKQSVSVRSNETTTVDLSIDNNVVDDLAAPSRVVVQVPVVAPEAPTGSPVSAPMLDLRGSWEGGYPDSSPATLSIDRQDGATFSGTLVVTTTRGKDGSEIQIEGTLSQLAVEIRETKVLKLGAVQTWSLATNSGTVQADGRRMTGTGRDNKTSYHWSFNRRAASDVRPAEVSPPVAAIADLRGRWTGMYAGSGAQLTIDRQDGSTFAGTLVVTTTAGGEDSEIQIQATLSKQTVEIQEIKVVKLGAAPNWGLGKGSGTLQADGQQMSGTGTDGRTRYRWSFSR